MSSEELQTAMSWLEDSTDKRSMYEDWATHSEVNSLRTAVLSIWYYLTLLEQSPALPGRTAVEGSETETPSSSPGMTLTAAGLNGESIGLSSLDVRVEIPGEPPITATVTFHDCSSPLTPGSVQRFLREGDWTQHWPMTSESPSLSGVTQSPIPEEVEVGRFVGGDEVEVHGRKTYEDFWAEKKGDRPASGHHKAGFHGGYWQALKEQAGLSSPQPPDRTTKEPTPMSPESITTGEQGKWHIFWYDDDVQQFCCCEDGLHPLDPATILSAETLNALEDRLRDAEGTLRRIDAASNTSFLAVIAHAYFTAHPEASRSTTGGKVRGSSLRWPSREVQP